MRKKVIQTKRMMMKTMMKAVVVILINTLKMTEVSLTITKKVSYMHLVPDSIEFA